MRSGDVAQTRRSQIETGLSVRKSADPFGSWSDLAHDPLQRIVGPQLDPVAVRKSVSLRTCSERE